MRIIDPYVEVPSISGAWMLKSIEKFGRTCYKSEGKVDDSSYLGFMRGLLDRGHESVLEHEGITVRIICDRGVSHELVRHRIAAYSQESTRYCNYSQDRFNNEIVMIKPYFWYSSGLPLDNPMRLMWVRSCQAAEAAYFSLINEGATPQEARSVLPNSLKTEIVVTYNLREWRHVFKLRCAPDAHPQMRQIMIPLLLHFRRVIPIIFSDIRYDTSFSSECYARIFVAGGE